MNQAAVNRLTDIFDRESVFFNEPMRNHTTFRIGGSADAFVMPKNVQQLRLLMELIREEALPFCMIGNGSNILVGDFGVRGVVIQIGRSMSRISTDGTAITAQAGAMLSRLAKEAYQHELTGLEFASGIPGALGGAVMMNAGAYGLEMKGVVSEVTYLDETAEVRRISGDACRFGYRSSRFSGSGCIILEARLELRRGAAENIRILTEDYAQRRSSKQPLELPSAGSVFKRPEGSFAGRLIEEAGLKGFRIGGAAVSEKHAGFIVNLGGATAADVLAVIEHIRSVVQEKTGVLLEPEIKLIGDFSG